MPKLTVIGPGHRCERCSVRNRTVCAAAGIAAQGELNRISRARTLYADETLLSENRPADIVGTVIAGVLRMTKTFPDGREQIVGLVYPGEFFGRPYAATTEFGYEAATDVNLCVIERHAFELLIGSTPELEHELLLRTLGELAFARERARLLGCQTTIERVATYLLMMLERGEQLLADMEVTSQKSVVASAISRRDLASYLSTTIETISRHIHHLSRQGVIHIIDSGHFEVLQYPALLAAAGLAQDDLKYLRSSYRSLREVDLAQFTASNPPKRFLTTINNYRPTIGQSPA